MSSRFACSVAGLHQAAGQQWAERAAHERPHQGPALFVGQAFLYNGVTFNLGTFFSTFYGISSTTAPTTVTSSPSGSRTVPGPAITRQWNRDHGSRSSRAGTFVSIVPTPATEEVVPVRGPVDQAGAASSGHGTLQRWPSMVGSQGWRPT
ncbi:hypothetical protein [Actinokineospora enzanensis]|uniref:hypothetical protein n=1 Tax=Actinokineospora enzanensis TaxID=155975 RepID=UPI0012EC6F24|nr:hypothetical protein [Actinokineospora enzanensis]